MLTTIIIFIIVLSLLVFVHEIGHFYAAKKFGIIPKEFGFGLPPRVLGVYKNKEGKWKKVYGNKEPEDCENTIYSLNWIPLGGFVNIGEDELESSDPTHFSNQKPWKRATILSAGVAMNVVLAAVLIIIGLMVGFPQSVDGLNSQVEVTNRQVQIMEVAKDSPADKAGFASGDVVLSVNNQKITSDSQLQQIAESNLGQELNYLILRGEEKVEIKVVPEIIESTQKGGVGIAVLNTGTVKYPWYLAIWEGIKMTFILLWLIIVAFYELIKSLVLGNGLSAELGGPVYIAQMVGDSARLGFVYLMQFTALLSINLAVINFIPFPALDGGRVLFLIIEKIKGSPVKREVETAMHYFGFILLMVLIVVVTFRDVLRVWNG